MRKRFACGHRGLGRYCHRCEDQSRTPRTSACSDAVPARLLQLRERERLAPIGLDAAAHLPAVLERALDILSRLDQGAHPLALGAKRLTSRHGDFSISVGHRYRLLIDATTLKPLRFISHETYNGLI